MKASFKDTWYEFLYAWLDPKNTRDRSTGLEWREMRSLLGNWGGRRGIRQFTRDFRQDRYLQAAAEDFWAGRKWRIK